MWNKCKQKIQKQKGETLVESLVSILIGALSIAMLVSSILASAKMNASNREADERFNSDLLRAEAALEETGYEATEVTVKINFNTLTDETKKVTLYGGEDGTFVSYEYETEETP